MYWKNFFAVLALVCSIEEAHAEVLQLRLSNPQITKDARIPSFVKINGTAISSGTLYIHREDISSTLERRLIELHNCEALLLPLADKISWLQSKMTPVVSTSAKDLPRGAISIVLQSPLEMIKVLRDDISGGSGGGGIYGPDSSRQTPEPSGPNQRGRQNDLAAVCRLEEVCFSKDGTATADFECPPFKVSVSTSGEINFGVSSADGSLSISASSDGTGSIKLQR
jgi:hypothetical protein